jgi:hypothetical protein
VGQQANGSGDQRAGEGWGASRSTAVSLLLPCARHKV